jgi:saccharopine dehydrogenase-like NADP-dependent oxidoreductase
MKKILVLGAGRTSTFLIKYFLENSEKENWFVTVADVLLQNSEDKVGLHPRGKAIQLDIYNDSQRYEAVSEADVVVSFLLPEMHIIAAKECLKCNTHLVTASYVSGEMAELNNEAKKKNLIFLNEMGLDPGIDHMDTARLIKKVKQKGGKITSLKSYCGGLVSPESDNNPWGYKFSWSPVSVVLAGQSGSKFLNNSSEKSLSYKEVFGETESVNIPGIGLYEAYPNRDSIPYLKIFDLEGVVNYYRATLRKPGFASAWNALIKIGFTDNSYKITNSGSMTYEDVIRLLLPSANGKSIDVHLAEFLHEKDESEVIRKLLWLGITGKDLINLKDATPAQILLSLLEKKWELKSEDKDMVILQTEVEFLMGNRKKKIISTMLYKGKDNIHTAMTYTASLPAAIGAKLIVQNKINEPGIIIPVSPDIYEPALKELEEYGIKFSEAESDLPD